MALTVTAVVKDDEIPQNPIEDVRIYVYDATDTFVTSGLTDVDGEVIFVLDGDPDPGRQYIFRMIKPDVVFDYPTQNVLVHEPLVPPATNVFDFTGHIPSVPESSDPDLCKISGIFIDGGNQPLEDVTISFRPIASYPTDSVGGYHYTGEPTLLRNDIVSADHDVQTDPSGYAEVSLIRGGYYDVHVYGIEDPDGIYETVQIPDKAGALFADVFFPYIKTAEFDTNPLAVNVAESEDVLITIYGTNDIQITDQERLTNLLEFTSADESIAQAEGTIDGGISVSGVSAGSTTITITRKDCTWAPRRPEIAALISTPLTVNVS